MAGRISVKLISDLDAESLHNAGQLVWVTSQYEHDIKYSDDPLLTEISPDHHWRDFLKAFEFAEWGSGYPSFYCDSGLEDIQELEL